MENENALPPEITPKEIMAARRAVVERATSKVNAGLQLPPPSPPSDDEDPFERVFELVSEGYSVTEICAVDGFPSAGAFIRLCESDAALKQKLKLAYRVRGLVLRESRLVNARSENKTSAFEMVARDVHIVDAPETNPTTKTELSGAIGILTQDQIIAQLEAEANAE